MDDRGYSIAYLDGSDREDHLSKAVAFDLAVTRAKAAKAGSPSSVQIVYFNNEYYATISTIMPDGGTGTEPADVGDIPFGPESGAED